MRRIVEATQPLQIIAFGSRARGDHRPDSDLDLAVILDSQESFVSPDPAYEAIQEVDMSIDLLVASKARYDDLRPYGGSVYHYVDQEGVRLYDRDHPEQASPRALYGSDQGESTLIYPLPDEILGFHAQQSCEKLLKALIAAHGLSPPLTHILLELSLMLELDCAEIIPNVPFRLIRLQPFAVQFRYDGEANLTASDRLAIRETVSILRAHTLQRILSLQTAPAP